MPAHSVTLNTIKVTACKCNFYFSACFMVLNVFFFSLWITSQKYFKDISVTPVQFNMGQIFNSLNMLMVNIRFWCLRIDEFISQSTLEKAEMPSSLGTQ